MNAKCYDCARPYGDEHGFPDLIVPDDVWDRISPTSSSQGLLCPSCICKRLFDEDIKCHVAFHSGPAMGDFFLNAKTGKIWTHLRNKYMGHHIDSNGQFQSDLHPDLPPDKIIVSFKHRRAWPALVALAEGYKHIDPEFSADIRTRLKSLKENP